MNFTEQLNLFLKKRLNSKYIQISEHTPAVLQKIGINDYPILMETRGLKKAFADKGSTGDNYHGLGIEGISQLPDILNSPAIVLNSLSHPRESVVIVADSLDKNGYPIVLPIKLNQKANYNFVEIDSNIVMTAYGRASFGDFLKDNIAAQTIVFADKEKSQRLLDSGLQLPITLDSATIIRPWNEDVNDLEQRISLMKAHKFTADGVYQQMLTDGIQLLIAKKENTMDETNTTEPNKTTEARAKAQRLVQETGEPYVTIEFSENSAFDSGDVLPLSVADKKLAKLDAEHEGDGYDKVKLHIDYIKDGKPDSYEGCRFDIGDEQQGLVSHIQSFWQFYLDNKNWRKRLESEHSPDYVKSAYEEYERMAHDVAPFLKRHVELADMIERTQSVSDFTSEDVATVIAHVARERAELNGVPAAAENGEHEKKDDVIERVAPKVSTPTDVTNKPQQSAPSNYRDKVTEIRDTMIQAILARIEKDPLNWTAGWNKVSGNPVNGKTDTAYRGLNSIYLYLMSEQHGYNDPRWVTFNQAKALGASIKKGEKSYPVLFYERYDKLTKKEYDPKTTKSMTEEERAEYERENVRFVLKYYSVFNAAQCVNFPELDKSALLMSEEERANQNELIEMIIANSAAPVNYDGGSRAYYQPSTDSIHLPTIENFHSMQDYYATALHEIAHSTGHESRLNRDLSGGFGSQSYAVEELRAELACVFMQIEHGINIEGNHIDNHAAYVQSWLEAAKSDPTVFYKAVRDAGKIADYVDDNYLQAIVSDAKEEVTEEIKAEERTNVNKLEENVREWYTSTFPTDELGADLDGGLSFGDVADALSKGENIYDVLGVEDSIVRERVFGQLAELQDKSYSEIYDAWVNDNELKEINTQREHYSIEFNLNYSYEMLLSNELRIIGYRRDNAVDGLNISNDETSVNNGETYWLNELRYNGIDGKTIQGYYGRTFNGVTLEATNIAGFETFGLNEQEVQVIAQIVQGFGVDVNIKKTNAETVASDGEHKEENEYRALKIVLNNARNGEPLTEYITIQGSNYLIKVSDLIMKYGGEERDGNYYITTAVEEKFAELQSKYEKEGEHKEKISPLYQKYIETQRKHPNAFIFQRVGDFYEVIGETAKEVASRLDLTLMSRDVGLPNRAPMCGVPYHAIDEYVTKLREFGDVVIEREEGRFEELRQHVETVENIQNSGQLEGQTSIFELPQEQGEHKEKLSREERRVRQYADALKKTATEMGFTVRSDEYYLKKAREEIAEYEQSDEYKQAVMEDFPKEFEDEYTEAVLDGIESGQVLNSNSEALDRKQYAERVREMAIEQLVGYGYDRKTAEQSFDSITERYKKEFQSIEEYSATIRHAHESLYNSGMIDKILTPQDLIALGVNVKNRASLQEEKTELEQPKNNVQRDISAGQTQNAPTREWFNIDLPEGSLGKRYGENTMVKMPQGEYAYYALFLPTRLIKTVDGKQQLRVASDLTYRLNNDGRQVELTGLELRDSFAGMQIGKQYKRVAPSRAYAKVFADLEKNVPEEMKALPNWCVYRTWQKDEDKKGKVIKSAITGNGICKDNSGNYNPSDFTDFATALKYAKENSFVGLSFLLDAKNGITCIDLDKCVLNAETGEMKERATKLIDSLKGTYMERSASGNGVHIFIKDDILKGGKYRSISADAQKGELEVFDNQRIISMTGNMFSETNALTRAGSAAIVYLRQELGEQRRQPSVLGDSRPRPSNGMHLSDSELVRWIRSSKRASDFDALYSGKGLSGDKSNDDAKLAHILLYFSGGDKEQTFRIMRESGQNRTDKPDSYYRHTIEKMDEKITEYAKLPTSFAADGAGRGGGRRSGKNNRGSQA